MKIMTRACVLAAVVVCLPVLPANSYAQSCQSCTIQVAESLPLVIPEELGGTYGHPLAMTIDSRGRIWVMYEDQMPVLFESDGSFVRRFGSRGSGPSEFSSPTRIIAGGGDSIVVVDPGNLRLTVWSHELELGRTIRMPFAISRSAHVVDWPNQVLGSSLWMGRTSSGWPLHFFDLGGDEVSPVESFGAERGEVTGGPLGALAIGRRITPALGGGWWIADALALRARRWSSDAILVETLTAETAWFGDPLRILREGGGLPSAVDGVWEDPESGDVWLFARVGDSAKMNAAIQELRASSGRGEATAFDLPKGSEVYRSHAVILGRDGRLLADIPIDGLVVEVAPDGRALVARPTSLGLVDVRLERLNLSR